MNKKRKENEEKVNYQNQKRAERARKRLNKISGDEPAAKRQKIMPPPDGAGVSSEAGDDNDENSVDDEGDIHIEEKGIIFLHYLHDNMMI